MSQSILKTPLLSSVALTGAAIVALASPRPAAAADADAPIHADKVARGKYLVTIAGCNDCHTPLKMVPPGRNPI
jgi:mono/diheme cytochrome c family protein